MKDNLKGLAYSTIKERIIKCDYSPGTLLKEENLVNELNIGRTPVRDALGRLEQEKLLTIKSKKGILISPIDFEEINHVYEMRMLLEPYSLQAYGNRLDEKSLLHWLDVFSQPIDVSDLLTSDEQFHQFIISATPNHYIGEYYQALQNQNKRFNAITGLSKGRQKATDEEHKKIIEACLMMEWDQAAVAMKEHLLRSKYATVNRMLQKQRSETTKEQK